MNQKDVKWHVYKAPGRRSFSFAPRARGVLVVIEYVDQGHIFINSKGEICFHLLELQLREKL